MKQEAFSRVRSLGDDRSASLREIEKIKDHINEVEIQIKDILIREGGIKYLIINWKAISRDIFAR